jgi:RNA methyltransferase, TrmH family
MALITSLQNPRVKAAAHLRDRKHRQRQGRIVIDGVRELTRALRGGVRLSEVFVCPSLGESDESRALFAELAAAGVEILEVSPAVFDKLAFGDRAEGVLGVAPSPRAELADLRLGPMPLVGVLEGVEKPGNLGAVLRTADGAGLSALVAADLRTDLHNPNAIRASLGTIFTLPVAAASTAETLAWLTSNNLAVYAARVDGSVPYTDADFRRPAAIVLGSEADGLSSAWTGPQVTAIRLPMRGSADSLNVAATAAVLFYEALRQRTAG